MLGVFVQFTLDYSILFCANSLQNVDVWQMILRHIRLAGQNCALYLYLQDVLISTYASLQPFIRQLLANVINVTVELNTTQGKLKHAPWNLLLQPRHYEVHFGCE